MTVFWDRVSKLFVRHRLALTLGVALMTLLTAAGIFPPLGPLKFDDRSRNFIKTSKEDFDLLAQMDEDFGSGGSDCYLLIETTGEGDLFSEQAVEGLRYIIEQVRGLTVILDGEQSPAVEHVRSMAEVEVVTRLPGRFLRYKYEFLLPKAPDQDEDETHDAYQVRLEEYRANLPAALEKARTAALQHKLVAGQLLSADARSTLAIARLSPKFSKVLQFGQVVDGFHEIANSETLAGFGLRLRVTGVPAVRVEIYRSIIYETVKFTLIAVGLACLMAWILFRQFSLVVICCVGPWAGALWTIGMMGLVGEPLNIINVVLPTLVVIVGFTNSIHLVVDMRRSLAEGQTSLQAAAGSIRQLGGACGLAALTTAIGFGSLIASESEIIQRFGLVCGAGALLAFLAVVTCVPLMASVLLRPQAGAKEGQGTVISRGVDVLIDRMIGHRKAVTCLGLLVTGVLALSAWQLKPDTIFTETIPKNREASETLDRVDEKFGGALVAIVHLEWPETMPLQDGEESEEGVVNEVRVDYAKIVKVLESVQDIVDEHDELSHPMSMLNLIQSMPASMSTQNALNAFPKDVRNRFLRMEPRRAILVSRIKNIGAAKHEPVYREIEGRLNELEEELPGFQLRLTGMPVVSARNIKQMIGDLQRSLTLAAVVIFFVITIAFRSPRLGAISVLPNVFPLVVTSAVLVLAGQPLQLPTVIVFTICLGIAVDDTIHLITRFRQELSLSGDVEVALRRSGRSVGTALVTSTLVLLAGFGSLMFAEVPATLLFATYTSIGIAAALVGDLIFLPAMLAWFAKAGPRDGAALSKSQTLLAEGEAQTSSRVGQPHLSSMSRDPGS